MIVRLNNTLSTGEVYISLDHIAMVEVRPDTYLFHTRNGEILTPVTKLEGKLIFSRWVQTFGGVSNAVL